MALAEIAGRVYGPVACTLSATKSAEYVAATGDDPERWVAAAPPAYAGALLFVVAPLLIADPDVGEHTRVLVHSDQRFRWHGPLTLGTDVVVTGTVTRVRERGGLNFVTFEAAVARESGAPLIDSTSTFLMGSSAAAEPGPDPGEPPVGAGSSTGPVLPVVGGADGSVLQSVQRSASRLDLVRYAGASGDFNPIHFDHDAARLAGLDGIVVHGLLMAAWLAQLAASANAGDSPLAEMTLRFRNALRPAEVAVAFGEVTSVAGESVLSLALRRGDVDLVTAKASLANA